LFVVAHEFGHVYANHLDNLLPRLRFPANGGDENNSSHVQEFEADALGLMLMLGAQAESGYSLELCYVGAELFFHALDMQEKFAQIMESGPEAIYISEASDSHPSNEMRRLALRQSMVQFLGDTDEVKSALAFAIAYEKIIVLVWEEIRMRYA